MDLMPTINMNEVIPDTEELQEELMPSPKQQIKQEDIFKDFAPAPTETTATETPKQDKIKVKKKRPPMSEEHKEKLKQARGKALETRRRNAREKAEIKELQKMKKKNELEQLRAEVNGDKPPPRVKEVIEEVQEYKPPPKPKPEPAPQPAPQPRGQYTKEDILKAQQEAVMSYERARQYKKKIKKEQEEKEEAHRLKMATAISRNTPPQRHQVDNYKPRLGDNDYWDNCF
tara:strand:- start:7131 stop:7820 length:690 start_codon:yes stop_codon:yes gene_type:complete